MGNPLEFLEDAISFTFGWIKDLLVPDMAEQEKGITQTFASPDAKFPVIYGTQGKVSGVIVFQDTNDADSDDIKNDLLHIIIVWSEGECKSIDQIYIDDIAITDDRFKVEGQSSYWAHARNFPNGMGNYSDALLTAAGWRANDKLEGKCCTYLRCEYTEQEDVWQGFPKVTADISGRMISTPAGGAQTNSENPVDILYDYLKNSVYGKGLTTTDIDVASFTAQRPTTVIQVEETTGGGVYRDNFTCNVILPTTNTVLNNVNTILKSMRGWLPVIDGKLSLVIEKDDTTADFTLTEDNIIQLGAIKNSSKSNRYNRVIVKYIDPDAEWEYQEVIYPDVGSQTETDLLAEDNGIVLEKSVTLETCTNFYEAKAFAKTLVDISREQLRTTVLCEPEASILTVGDIIPVTHSYPGWSGKLFRVDSTSENLETGETTLQLREHQPYIYDFANTGLKPSIPDTTITYDRPAAPTTLLATEVNSELIQVSITWAGITSKYEVAIYNPAGELILNEKVGRKQYSVNGFATETYTFQVRAIGGLGKKSEWASLSFDVVDRTFYVWKVYADDIDGLNISSTDETKPFVGYAFGKLTATPVLDADLYGFFPNTAAQFLFGTGVPASGLGNVGDTYIEQSTGDIYKKTSSGWGSPVGNFAPGDGDEWLSGTSVPASGTGADGDWYIKTDTYDLYQKVAGTWEPRGTIQGAAGANGLDALGYLPASISPAYQGGTSDIVYAINRLSNGTFNAGEIAITGGTFEHPDGTTRTFTSPIDLVTPFGETGGTGHFYIMWSDTDIDTRTSINPTQTTNGNFFVVAYNGSGWEAIGNDNSRETLTLVDTDCFLAACYAEDNSGGIDAIFPYTGGLAGTQGPQGVQGPQGPDGVAYYTWIRYADSDTGTGISNSPTNKTYIGFAYNKTTATESNDPNDYAWSLIQGDQGDTGVQGPQGPNGDPTYTWIKYSANSDGTGLTDLPQVDTEYIGIAPNKTTATESNDKTDYIWSLFKGADGSNGIDGADGIDGIDGADGLTALPASISPAKLGGSGDFVFILDYQNDVANEGEIQIEGNRFFHPDGTQRTITNQIVNTNFGEGKAGLFYLMWTDTASNTRYPALVANGLVDGNIVAIEYGGGIWRAINNTGQTVPANLVATDCILAVVEAEATTGGLTGIVPFVSGAFGLDGSDGSNGDDGLKGSTPSLIYKLVTDGSGAPATPTGGSFDGTTETIPTGWTDEPTYGGVGTEYVSRSRYNEQIGGSWTRGPDWSTPAVFAIRGQQGNTGPVGPSNPQSGTFIKDEDTANVVAGTTVVSSITVPAGDWRLRSSCVFVVENSGGSRTATLTLDLGATELDTQTNSGAISDLSIEYDQLHTLATATAFQFEVVLSANADTATADGYVEALSQ